MPRCRDCKHWGDMTSARIIDERPHRECHRIDTDAEQEETDAATLAYITLYRGEWEDGWAHFITAADFGCFLFEPNDK